MTNKRPVVVLTGGPGGGKSTLIDDLRQNPMWTDRFVALPEAAQYARFANISPSEKLFQRTIVNLQMGLEDGLDRALGPGGLALHHLPPRQLSIHWHSGSSAVGRKMSSLNSPEPHLRIITSATPP